MLDALTGAPGELDTIAEAFYTKTRELMVTESWTSTTHEKKLKNVDVVRDVLKYVPLYWACEVVRHNCGAVLSLADAVCIGGNQAQKRI